MKADLYNQEAQKVGTVEVPDGVFNRKWSAQLVHQVLVGQAKNKRKPLAHTKGRGDVRGGGKKPWAQKHTGRARHSSIRSPIWKGGGVAHGPIKERIFTVKINKKMNRAAILSVLSRRFKDNEIKIIDSLAIKDAKTKSVVKLIKFFGTHSALIVPGEKNKMIYRASRNIPRVRSISPKALNVYDLLRHKNILMDKESLPVISETYKIK